MDTEATKRSLITRWVDTGQPRRKNARAQNFAFDVKKAEYFRVDEGTPFVLTSGLANTDTWDFSALEERHDKYLEIIIKDWSLEKAYEGYCAI